jgi:hypothetical protein
MNRRDFLQRAALVAAGTVAVDQLGLLDRLGWKRRFFGGWSPEYTVYRNVKYTALTVEPDGLVTMEYALPTEPIIGARYTPDIWAQPTITYVR